jgi:hypothetical protein
MKYVKSFESHRKSKVVEPVNEELFGGIINFFKGLWSKAMEELKKLGKDPDTQEVKDWIGSNPFNPADNNYLFKNVMDEFKKKPEANDQDALTLVDSILNPETGVLGKQGLAPLYENLKKAFPPLDGEPASSQFATFEYIFNTIRTKAIIQYKFAASTDGKVDPKKINIDLKDMTHLPDVKKLLTAATDGKKKKDAIVNWCEKTLFPQLDKLADAITEEEVNKYLEGKKIPVPEGGEGDANAMTYDKLKEFYDKKTPVIYKLKDFKQEDWDKLSDDQKKKPKEEPASKIVGVKVIDAINDQDKDDSVTFLDKDEKPTIKKGYKDIVGPSEAEGKDDLVKKLRDLQTKKPEDIKKVGTFVDFISDEANKDKVVEIDKIIGGGESAATGA